LAWRGFTTRKIALRELSENKLAPLGIDVSRVALNLHQCAVAQLENSDLFGRIGHLQIHDDAVQITA